MAAPTLFRYRPGGEDLFLNFDVAPDDKGHYSINLVCLNPKGKPEPRKDAFNGPVFTVAPPYPVPVSCAAAAIIGTVTVDSGGVSEPAPTARKAWIRQGNGPRESIKSFMLNVPFSVDLEPQ